MGVGGEGVVRNVWGDHWLHERIETPYGAYAAMQKACFSRTFNFVLVHAPPKRRHR